MPNFNLALKNCKGRSYAEWLVRVPLSRVKQQDGLRNVSVPDTGFFTFWQTHHIARSENNNQQQATMKTLNNLLNNNLPGKALICGLFLVIQTVTGFAGSGSPAYLQFNSSNYSTSATNATITVTRTTNLNEPTSVNYETADGTAVAGVNYLATSGTLTFNPGETAKTFSVEIIPQNNATDKTLSVRLCCATYSGFITRGTATVTIAATPRLQLSVVAGNTLRVSWPTNAVNYVLEACDDYATQNWEEVANTPVVVNNQNAIDFSTSGPVKIFRLRQI